MIRITRGAVAVGTRVSSRAPRTEPYGRLSRIRLPPRVYDGNCLPYTLQRLRHASLALSPVRALLVRIPLGPRPSLHRLRCACPCRCLRSGLVRFVRRLHSYYGEVRLLASVHHRLGSSPSRCGPPYSHRTRRRRPDTRPPSFRYDPFARDVALDP